MTNEQPLIKLGQGDGERLYYGHDGRVIRVEPAALKRTDYSGFDDAAMKRILHGVKTAIDMTMTAIAEAQQSLDNLFSRLASVLREMERRRDGEQP